MKLQFSDQPCPECSWSHQIDAFRPGQIVETTVARYIHIYSPSRFTAARTVGTVISSNWYVRGGVALVHVEFADGIRSNYYPCELEHTVT